MLEKKDLGNGMVRVTFRLSQHIWADHIALAGEFNDWSTHSHLLEQTRDDEDWHISIDLPAGRTYRFRYIVDDNGSMTITPMITRSTHMGSWIPSSARSLPSFHIQKRSHRTEKGGGDLLRPSTSKVETQYMR
ncbi:MAG: hypothetical protein GXP39_15920 [Chloroflexi bacterium]|nr:hypothetical protein [Chloroflexota bacterium]